MYISRKTTALRQKKIKIPNQRMDQKYQNSKSTHPTEDVFNSSFESVMVIMDTCLVVSILQGKKVS